MTNFSTVKYGTIIGGVINPPVQAVPAGGGYGVLTIDILKKTEISSGEKLCAVYFLNDDACQCEPCRRHAQPEYRLPAHYPFS